MTRDLIRFLSTNKYFAHLPS